MRLLTWSLSAVAVCALGCGTVSATFTPPPDAAASPDATAVDAAAVDAPIDAPIDAPPPPPPPPPPGTARELTVVGGAVTDARYRLEVEITGGAAPGASRNGAHQLESALTVTVSAGGN
ncbi:MAG: hypothetical protein IPL61_25490 [Myxococcales bacterium]|nr:hypothetical protein [Myxococcales bacterium]